MVRKVEMYIKKMHMIQPEDRVFVALSGGADSVCLFLILEELRHGMNFSLEAIHVEHGIRGEESKKDAEFVRILCQRYEVPLHLEVVDVPSFAREEGLGLEEAARILRHKAFYKYAGPMDKLAVAHHMEDHAETVLFQMARGTGITGMCGLTPVRVQAECVYIRPLLESGRKDIEAFLEEKGEDYCADSTNEDLDYSRNRIRHEILPELEQINEKAIMHILQMSEEMSEIEAYLKQELEVAKKACLRLDGEAYINLEAFRELPLILQREIILSALEAVCGKRKDITRLHVEAVRGLVDLQSGRSVDLPYDMKAVREFQELRVFQQADVTEAGIEIEVPDLKEGECFHVDLPGGTDYLDFEVVKFDGDCQKIPKNPYTKWFNYGKIKNSILVRQRREKDYLTMDEAGHQKKLKDYLVEARIPASKRWNIPLIAIGNEVLWVPKGRSSENYRVYKDTEYILVIKYNGGHQS